MIRFCLSAALVLTMTGRVLAQIPSPGGLAGPPAFAPMAAPVVTPPAPLAAPLGAPMGRSSVPTSSGPGLVTGTAGGTQSIMLPGSPTGGWLTNNGNGTSTLIVPGSVPQVVITPR